MPNRTKHAFPSDDPEAEAWRHLQRCKAVEHNSAYSRPSEERWAQLEAIECADAVAIAPARGAQLLCAFGCSDGVITVINAYTEKPLIMLKLRDLAFFPKMMQPTPQTHEMQQCVCVRWSPDCSRIVAVYDLKLKSSGVLEGSDQKFKAEKILHSQMFVFDVPNAKLLYSVRLPFRASGCDFLFSNTCVIMAADDSSFWTLDLNEQTLRQLLKCDDREGNVIFGPSTPVSDVPLSMKPFKRTKSSADSLLLSKHATLGSKIFMLLYHAETKTVFKIGPGMRVESYYKSDRTIVKFDVSTSGSHLLVATDRGPAILLRIHNTDTPSVMTQEATLGKWETTTLSVSWVGASFSTIFNSPLATHGVPPQAIETCLLTASSNDSDFAIRHRCFFWNALRDGTSARTNDNFADTLSIHLPEKEQILQVSACLNYPLRLVLDSNGNCWLWRQRLKSDFPGPMYPPGFTLMQFVEFATEKEDALDLEVYDLECEDCKDVVFPKDRKPLGLEDYYSEKRLRLSDTPWTVEPEVDVVSYAEGDETLSTESQTITLPPLHILLNNDFTYQSLHDPNHKPNPHLHILESVSSSLAAESGLASVYQIPARIMQGDFSAHIAKCATVRDKVDQLLLTGAEQRFKEMAAERRMKAEAKREKWAAKRARKHEGQSSPRKRKAESNSRQPPQKAAGDLSRKNATRPKRTRGRQPLGKDEEHQVSNQTQMTSASTDISPPTSAQVRAPTTSAVQASASPHVMAASSDQNQQTFVKQSSKTLAHVLHSLIPPASNSTPSSRGLGSPLNTDPQHVQGSSPAAVQVRTNGVFIDEQVPPSKRLKHTMGPTIDMSLARNHHQHQAQMQLHLQARAQPQFHAQAQSQVLGARVPSMGVQLPIHNGFTQASSSDGPMSGSAPSSLLHRISRHLANQGRSHNPMYPFYGLPHVHPPTPTHPQSHAQTRSPSPSHASHLSLGLSAGPFGIPPPGPGPGPSQLPDWDALMEGALTSNWHQFSSPQSSNHEILRAFQRTHQFTNPTPHTNKPHPNNCFRNGQPPS